MKRVARGCIFLIIVTIIAGPSAGFAESRTLQRQDYLAAKRALAKNQITEFNRLADGLKDYPLYPYLRYDYLKSRLWKVKEIDVVNFLERHDDLPVANSLRITWLKHLARGGRWKSFLTSYTPQKSAVLQCYQLRARMETGDEDHLLEDIRTLWLVGKSQPPKCDPAFELLYKSDLMTDELIWQRIRLAMGNNQPGLANYLARRLDAEHRKWAAQWIAVHKDPARVMDRGKFGDTPINREILVHGIGRLAKRNLSRAIDRWEALQKQYVFMPAERSGLDRLLAVSAAANQHPMTVALLDRIDNGMVDEEVFHWRLRTALHVPDWYLLRRWTEDQPATEKIELRWKYWHARALEETGATEKAKRIYAQLATERDYYGFIAADRIKRQYSMNYFSLSLNPGEMDRIAAVPAMQRAYEFYRLDMPNAASREWLHCLDTLTSRQMQIAAMLATKWGWHDRVIMTLGKARAYDDLVLRFPILYEDLLGKYAGKRGLDSNWMFGLVRAESAFMENVKSPAGALGLMQVMPATGKMVAKRIGLKNFKTGKLRQAETNVPIGSAYLRMMLDKFKGNMVLATAAYNAGPHRVKTWLSQGNDCEAPDVWVEKIPYKETRKYVRRVFYFASVYDWRMDGAIVPISQRMSAGTDGKKSVDAGSRCFDRQVSYRN